MARRPEPSAGARHRPGSPRARLFVALELEEPARSRLAAWRDSAIAGRDDLRPISAGALHVTLVFLGYRPEKEIAQIARTASSALEGHLPALLVPLAVEPVPRRDPRLFALDLDDEGERARGVQAVLSRALERERFYKPERRAFWPHVTMARVKRGRRALPLKDDPPKERIEGREVTLYRSLPSPQGARYEPLERFQLAPSP